MSEIEYVKAIAQIYLNEGIKARAAVARLRLIEAGGPRPLGPAPYPGAYADEAVRSYERTRASRGV